MSTDTTITKSTEKGVSGDVLELLHRHRRVEESAETETIDRADRPSHADNHRNRLDHFIEQDQPIHFVLPAFPAKSPNRDKVLGELPDLSEQLALNFLQSLCDQITHFYKPGARVTICSDGHVFGDVVGVADGAVTEYREAITEMIETESLGSLSLFGLDDAFGSKDYVKLREVLERDHADTLADLRERIRTDPGTRSLFNGIHRFMFEDAAARNAGTHSKSLLRKQSKEAAYQTIRRSNAWSRVVSESFPNAVRLSIHPQPPESEKLGLHLLRTRNSWLTPWHGVVLDDGVNYSLVKRWEAERLGASVVRRHGRPSHFVAPHLSINSRKEVPA